MVHHFVCTMYTCWRFVTFCGFDTLTFCYSWEIIRKGSVREVGRMMACREVGRQIISDSGLDYLGDRLRIARSRGELPAAGSLTVFGLIWLLALGKPPTHKPSARSSGVPWQFVCLGHQGLPHVSIWWSFQCYLTIKSDTGQHSQFLRCFLNGVLSTKVSSSRRAHCVEISLTLREEEGNLSLSLDWI